MLSGAGVAIAVAALAASLLASCARYDTERSAPDASAARQPISAVGHERSKARAPSPSASTDPAPVDHCAANAAAQRIIVSIAEQYAWLCARARTVYSTAVTTGREHPGNRTPTGTFHVQGRDRDAVLRPDDGKRYPVEYWIPFDAPDYGFHDASWQHFPYGSSRYRTDGSHGCVHMPLTSMQFLYRWVRVGASVTIRA